MSSLLRTKGVQIGQDNTATNNFTLYQPGVPDGTLRIGNGNSGSTTDAITINSSGNVGIGTSSPNVNGPLSIERNGNASSELNISLINGISNKECIVNFGSDLTTSDRYKGRIFYQTDNNVMGFWTNKTERMRIDSNGYVLKPDQPGFLMYNMNSNHQPAGVSNIVQYNTTDHNIGNHFNTSTGRFTVPVTGRYYFSYTGFQNNTDSTTAVESNLCVNGVRRHRQYDHNDNTTYGPALTLSAILMLSANDVVDIRNTFETHGSNGDYFSGYLLG